ncbi:MAG: agmatinase [Pseudobdellovibrionaceae bacterium]
MEYKPLSGREFPRFSGIKTFFRMPHVNVDADYDVGIFGIPYDGGVSYRPGGRFAPSKIREISSLGRGFHINRGLTWFQKLKVADIGDCPVVPIDQAQTYAKIEKFVSGVVTKNKKIIAVGGDHSTTLPVLRALKKKHGTLRLIHFDAHLDTYPAAWGCEYHHGAFARHAVDEGLIDPKKSMLIGIRGPLAGDDDLEFVRKHGHEVHTVDDIREPGLFEFLKKLGPMDATPTYITYDVDCLDPAFAPGTGTPVPGGLTTYEVQRILRAFKIPNLVGADVVEVSPPFDQADITSLAGMDAIFEFLCMMAANR